MRTASGLETKPGVLTVGKCEVGLLHPYWEPICLSCLKECHNLSHLRNPCKPGTPTALAGHDSDYVRLASDSEVLAAGLCHHGIQLTP